MKTLKKCPECGEIIKGKSCSCGFTETRADFVQAKKDRENLAYARACQEVRNFFKTPKGKELKAASDQTAKDLSLAMQSGPKAIRAMMNAQEAWPGDDCACEAGIIFYDKGQRYKVGRCDLCRRAEKPEDYNSVRKWQVER